MVISVPCCNRTESQTAEFTQPVSDQTLRDFFGDPDQLESALQGVGLVWVLGGNSFLLRKAMMLSGFDEIIHGALAKDALVYGGFSAGAVVVTPTLEGIHLMDVVTLTVEGYPDAVEWSGLNLFPKSIVPHYASPHPEAEAAERAVQYMQKNAMPFVSLRDGEVLVIDGDRAEILR